LGDGDIQTRREFLHSIGNIGGSAAVYQAMISMGLLMPGDATGAELRDKWASKSSQISRDIKPTVAVLGAGIAGLCAGYELKKAGFPVFIVEARQRPGGRNHTLRSGAIVHEVDSQQTCTFDDEEELYFNAGPARISQHHTNLLKYCRELKVPLQALVNDNRGAYIHDSAAFGGIPVRAREVITAVRGNITELLAKAINANALNGDIGIDERSFVLDVLRDYGNLNHNFEFIGSKRGGILSGTGGLTPPQSSEPLKLDDFFFDTSVPFRINFGESYNQAATMMQPVGGMDRIAYAFANELKQELYYGVEVTAMRRAGSRVRLEGRTNASEGAIEVDYAIVAMPPSVIKNIPNDFSLSTRNAIAAAEYAKPIKIAFQSPRFWETEEEIYGGISWTDSEILQIWYPSGGFGQEKGVIIGSYLFDGFHAENFANLSIEARKEFTLAAGEKVHSQYRENLSHGISVAWNKVPYSLGGWVKSAPSSILQKPDGPFLFAGDHLTYLHGWQEGAVISGFNALNNLLDIMELN
jgi:monoamine oxidase